MLHIDVKSQCGRSYVNSVDYAVSVVVAAAAVVVVKVVVGGRRMRWPKH
jgi:hypothetical protein